MKQQKKMENEMEDSFLDTEEEEGAPDV